MSEKDSPYKDQRILPATISTPDLVISSPDRQILRSLAGKTAELAALPIEKEKQELWKRHNALKPTRPVIFCDPENSWNEIIPQSQLQCTGALARGWEFSLRRQVFWGTQMLDDYTIRPFFDIPHVSNEWDWGLRETYQGRVTGRAYRWEAPIKTEADFGKLHFPTVQVDFEATQRMAELASQVFGDLLTVRVRTSWWWTTGMTWKLANLRGLEQIMLDMIENPAFTHRLMAFMRDGTIAIITALEEAGLLYPNWDGAYVGSGALGWADELPRPDFNDKVRMKDMWVLGESQETVGVSPGMFGEFIFPYQKPILERFGLVCYGCCEPIDKRWKVVSQLPNLRRISVSPWSNREKMAELLGDRYILSMKPAPSDLALDTFDEDRIRAQLRKDIQATRNCHVELVMKDNHTIRNDPYRVVRWVQIAREEIGKL